jgi:signal transduction histidine kinase
VAATEHIGHGLVGMRERVQMYGGQLHVGPGPDGGFQVRAVLPLDTDALLRTSP